jgi:hypothetical protein
MSVPLVYQDTATFVVAQSSGYGNSKTMQEQVEVPVIFILNVQFRHFGFQDTIDADAICWVDQNNAFVVSHFNLLEGMYVLAPLYGAADTQSWYKVTQVVVNRDHLLNNQIDNIELRLKKASAIPGVS